MKKRSERRKHCALAVVKWSQNFLPHHRPLPGGGGWDGLSLISWRWSLVTTFTYKPSLARINAHNFELS